MRCESCNQNHNPQNFAPTTSPFFPTGYINICFDCVISAVDGNNLNQVDRFLQHCNIAFMPNEWRKIWKREGDAAFKKYTNIYFDLKKAKYDWGEQNEKLMELAKQGLATSQLEELEPEFLDKLKVEWGDLPKLDLLRLEKFFNSSLNDYNVQTEAQRDMLRKVCRLSVLIDDDLSEGIVDKNKIQQYDKLMNSALKTLEQTQGDGITSVSEVIEFIEANGFQPKFYNDTPRDEIDELEKNIQEYLRDLVLGEVNLTELYESRKRIIQRKESDE